MPLISQSEYAKRRNVSREAVRQTSAARARLLALPYRIAVDAIAADGVFARIEAAAHALIREALEELHAYDPADYGPGGRLAK